MKAKLKVALRVFVEGVLEATVDHLRLFAALYTVVVGVFSAYVNNAAFALKKPISFEKPPRRTDLTSSATS